MSTWYIRPEPNPSGAYPPPQSNSFPGAAAMTEEQMQTLIAYNGYVALNVEDGAVVSVAPNTQAWEAWKATQPAPEDPLERAMREKLDKVNADCHAQIVAGCDVTLSDGTVGHISLTDEDQINLSAAYNAVLGGADSYPYHLDGQLCQIYLAADIVLMGRAATAHKLYHTTYTNHLHAWIERCQSEEEVAAIVYGAELPADLAANMEAVLAAAIADA